MNDAMKTKAAVLCQVNEPLRIEELHLPELKPGQVLVKIAYSGICRSQFNEISGLKGEDKYLPHTLGHEGSGVVEAVGAGVKKVKKGDRVVLTWIKSSGCDVMSARYERSDGSFVNSGAISTFLTKAVISENRLVKISDKMPLKEAALLGCAVPTGAGIVMNTLKVRSGDSIAVFGVGGIGLSALLAAKLKKINTVIAVDIVDSKLNFATELGATHIVNAKKQNALKEILQTTDMNGVDYAIECAGKKESMETALKSVRDNGGICIIAGNLPKEETISIDPFDLIKGKRIIGTWGGETNPDRDIALYADLFLADKLKLSKLITREYELEKINSAFNELSQEKTGRILIRNVVKEC